MRILPLCALAAVTLAVAAVHGQESAAPGNAELDTVEVLARKELGKAVHEFVSELTRLDGELISSWVKPICPRVVAENPGHAEYIRQRLFEVAADVPFAADADPECRANLFVIVTSEPEAFIDQWKKRDPGMFVWRPRRGVSRSPDELPVRTWHNVAIEPAGLGPDLGDLGSGGTVGTRLGGNAKKFKSKASRIESNVSENLQSALVLVDSNKAAGVTLRQLADYIAMVSFSKVDLLADFGKANSILRLFAADDSVVRPGTLTAWDLAFLRGLYGQSFEAIHQRTAISARMVRDLVDDAPRETRP